MLGVPQLVRYPDIPQAVHGKPTSRKACLESLDLAWIRGWESDNGVTDNIGDPDAILLVNCQGEWRHQLAWVLQRIVGFILAEDFCLAGIALGQIHQL